MVSHGLQRFIKFKIVGEAKVRSNSLIGNLTKLYLVSKVRKNWLNRNIDLNMLTEHLANFFKTCDFEAIKGETENGYQILAQNSLRYRFGGYVSITIQGKPEEFSIELELSGNTSRQDFPYPIMSTALLGGGYFISRALKSRDEWMRFEKDFWKHVDRVIDYLNTE